MIVKLLKAYKYKGVSFKKGDSFSAPRKVVVDLCREGTGVSNEDIPCAEKEKKKYSKKKKETKVSEGDTDVVIDNQL